jgi:hypothetical protein
MSKAIPNQSERLAAGFRAVPLGFKELGGPIEPRSPEIVQMDINDSPRYGEYVRVWPGAADNLLQVLDVDRSLAQLVLRVKEGRRRFTQQVYVREGRAQVEAEAQARGGRIIDEHGLFFTLELWTPAVERRYLIGRDDVRLFIAEVREGDTVDAAHLSLRPREVRQALARRPDQVLRQGEWFFLPLDGEGELIERHLALHPRAPAREEPLAPARRPHVADEVVRLERRDRRRRDTFARGAVRHADHRPLVLDGWRRVVRNREGRDTMDTGRTRVGWID